EWLKNTCQKGLFSSKPVQTASKKGIVSEKSERCSEKQPKEDDSDNVFNRPQEQTLQKQRRKNNAPWKKVYADEGWRVYRVGQGDL
ncbi:MAG: hypothetical protein LBQ54_07130, partial [Planctomycetaceae bacterium]|nr:hypothetical protein [Planctomycetaceae bacterium]